MGKNDWLISSVTFNPCKKKNQGQPEALDLYHSLSLWTVLPLKAESNTQRNTYKRCKLHCIQWKNELWCYGNTKSQRLLPQSVLVNLIQQKEETGVKEQFMSESRAKSTTGLNLCAFNVCFLVCVVDFYWLVEGGWTVCAYMSRLPGADMDLSSLLLGHSKGLLKERFLSMAFTKIWNVHRQKTITRTPHHVCPLRLRLVPWIRSVS